MPRIIIDLEERKGIITSWHKMGLIDTKILDRLKVQYEIQIAKKTLRRRLKD